jgi:hypothetical protein
MRLTKAAVLAEIKYLRDRLHEYTAMTHEELLAEYRRAFPKNILTNVSRELLIRDLMTAATYYVTNVLDLE